MSWTCGCSEPRPEGCSACNPTGAPSLDMGKAIPEKPHGCVCPVGAEATCRGDACPRRPRRMALIDRLR